MAMMMAVIAIVITLVAAALMSHLVIMTKTVMILMVAIEVKGIDVERIEEGKMIVMGVMKRMTCLKMQRDIIEAREEDEEDDLMMKEMKVSSQCIKEQISWMNPNLISIMRMP
jgi:hypothetical protein